MNTRVFAGKQIIEDKMTSVALSFEFHLKSEFDTTSTLSILALSFILLLTWKYRKSFSHFIGYGKFAILIQRGDRKPVPEENEETNCSQVIFFVMDFLPRILINLPSFLEIVFF